MARFTLTKAEKALIQAMRESNIPPTEVAGAISDRYGNWARDTVDGRTVIVNWKYLDLSEQWTKFMYKLMQLEIEQEG